MGLKDIFDRHLPTNFQPTSTSTSTFAVINTISKFVEHSPAGSGFVATVLSNIETKEHAADWIKSYGRSSRTNWNVRWTHPNVGGVLFRKDYVCEESAFVQKKRVAKMNTDGCSATITIMIDLPENVKREMPCTITVNISHNHETDYQNCRGSQDAAAQTELVEEAMDMDERPTLVDVFTQTGEDESDGSSRWIRIIGIPTGLEHRVLKGFKLIGEVLEHKCTTCKCMYIKYATTEAHMKALRADGLAIDCRKKGEAPNYASLSVAECTEEKTKKQEVKSVPWGEL